MHVSGIPVDLYSLLQFGFTAVLIGLGLLHLVKSTASKYFVVDASFDEGGDATAAAEGRRKSQEPMIAVAGGGDGCAVCGNSASKKCSGCKAVRYCTETCQSKHWKAGHKLKCKELKLLALDSRQNLVSHGGNTVVQQIKKVLFPYEEFAKLFNWEKAGFPPCGLLNCGNSCFANVVLQCLSCTRPLVAYLLEKDHRRECRRNDWCFLCELQNHVQRARQSLQPFSPLNILSRLPNIGGNLGYGKQEDAHEFMRFAIDTMQSVCLDEFGGEKSLHPSSQETTLIQYIFGGHLQSQVTCTKCKKISHRYENMMDLTVEIQGDAASLEDCLDQFTAQEWLDGENMYKCDGCNDYVKACKRLTIFRAPNVLTIALKRFQSGRFGKLNKRVTFPETLDLSQYMSEPGDGTDLYQLYAVVVHIDMLNASFFGHYICYTKDFGGNWYMIDDYKVATVELEEVLAQGAYMLLYRRTSVRPSHAKPLETLTKQQQQMELIKGNLPCLNTNYGQVNSISRDEIMPFVMTSPTEEFCSRKEDSVNMDIDDPIGVTHTSNREYQQDQDLSNAELVSLGSKDFDIDREHSNSSESVATSQIVQRGISNSNSTGESSLSIQVSNMQPEASDNDYDVECSFEDGGRTGGNFNKESVCTEIMDDCLPIENDIHEMAEKPRSGGSVDGIRISHEAHGASFQRLPNPRLERAVIVESGEEVPAALAREVKISKLDAGSPCLPDKLKPLFTPGFLDKSTRCKSLNMNGKAQVPHEVSQSREVASNCNGSTKPGSPHQGNRGVDDNHVSFDLDGQGRCRFTDKQLNKCSNGVDVSFDNLHSEEVASPAEHACKVVYSSPPLSQSSSVEAHGLKHEAWGRRFDGDHCFENGNRVALHDLETPVSSLSQNGGHEMETSFSVPVTVSSAIDESNLTCLTHLRNPRLNHQVTSFKSESNFPAALTTEAKSSKLSEENSCSSGERITWFSPGFVDKQVGQTYQNGNGSQMEICEDGLIQSINDCNGDIKSDFLHRNSCEINDPDGIFLNHNGQLTSGFIDNQHENCMDEDGATNGVLGETGKKLIHCNGNSGSVSDEDKKIGNFQAAFRGNDKALFSPGFHDKSVKKKSHEKDVEGRDASEIVSSMHDRNKLPRIG